MRVKGIIVYVSNKPFMSDFNALQLEPARIRQMSLFNPTADGLTTPTTWQPPLPPDAPPPRTATRQRSLVFDSYLDSINGPIVRPYVTTVSAGIFCISATDARIAAVHFRIPVPILQSESARGYEVTNRVHSGRCTSYHQDAQGIVCVCNHTQL